MDFVGVAVGVRGSTDIVTAFGGRNPVVSYPLHKFFEASIISIVYAVYVQRNSIAKKTLWQLLVLGLLFGLTSVIGSVVGYFVPLDTTFFYAFSVTSGFYAAIRLAGPLIANTKGTAARSPHIWVPKASSFWESASSCSTSPPYYTRPLTISWISRTARALIE